MVQPRRASVRPRVFSSESGASLPLEGEILTLLADKACGTVALIGPPGAGKTTALAHLAAVLPPDADLMFLDEPEAKVLLERCPECLVVYAASSSPVESPLATFRLAPWTNDELIEYLLAVHKERCASVMRRVQAGDHLCFDGLPDVWQIVLSELAADPSLPNARAALHRHLEAQLPDTDLVERARSACLNALVGVLPIEVLEQHSKPGFPLTLIRLLRYEAIRLLLAAERVAADLRSDADCDCLALRMPRELIGAAVREIRGDDRAIEHLKALLAGPSWSHPMAASLVHALDSSLLPKVTATLALAGAYLEEAEWPGVGLAGADISGADLSGSNLSGGDLSGAWLIKANLSGAILRGSKLAGLRANEANLSYADLSSAQAPGAVFDRANLSHADLEDSVLRGCSLKEADLTGANLRGAGLLGANLIGVRVEGTDFSGADLSDSRLDRLPLRKAILGCACFSGTRLVECDLELVELPGANFWSANLEGALLTGSRMPGADFRKASLARARMAEIEWEGAILCDADLRGATFHMGSTRSGLVNSPIACEGSKTGFYTDDYDEQHFKSPEEIRKANLCGADLRGALIGGVDFYLVDVRGARYDPNQEKHLRRCGAILEAHS